MIYFPAGTGESQSLYLHPARAKSMNPRSTSVPMSSTRTRSPTSRPSNPRISFPSTGGWNRRTQVPFSEAPVKRASSKPDIVMSTCCLIRKCYREGSLTREGGLEPELRIFLSLSSMAFLSTKGLSCSSCFERVCFTGVRM